MIADIGPTAISFNNFWIALSRFWIASWRGVRARSLRDLSASSSGFASRNFTIVGLLGTLARHAATRRHQGEFGT
ncbi:MAG: hypothetical protein HY264_06145 [Chloroflexi bacterium]|nr:hypothetical protein [Chloroflexota bacterium]